MFGSPTHSEAQIGPTPQTGVPPQVSPRSSPRGSIKGSQSLTQSALKQTALGQSTIGQAPIGQAPVGQASIGPDSQESPLTDTLRRSSSAIATPPGSLAQLSLSSPSRSGSSTGINVAAGAGTGSPALATNVPNADIWSPLYRGGARGGSFGAYGAVTSLGSLSARTSASPSFDSERFHSGGMAWGSAELPRRRMVSFPSAEPGFAPESVGDRGSTGRGSVSSTSSASETQAPFLAALKPKEPNQKLDFTVPAVSIFERFSNLGDATARAEMSQRVASDELHSPQISPSLPHKQMAGAVPVPVPVSVPVPNLESMPIGSSVPVPAPSSAAVSSPAASNTPNPSKRNFSPATRKKRQDSPILEKLRSQGESLQLEDLLGSVIEASTDQYGSRFIQERLPSASAATKRAVVGEVIPAILSLATDVFGNYVVQLLLNVSSPADRRKLSEPLKTHILSLSLQMYGCRVIQVALKNLGLGDQKWIVAEISGHVNSCIRDHNGNHVVQKAIEYMPSNELGFVYDVLLEDPITFSTHMYGCRVVQRALEHSQMGIQRRLMATIGDYIDMLVLDQYGNYVVQHVVENGPPADREMVFNKLLSRVVKLSEHKYASNVVEKCFIKGTGPQRTQMVDTIVNTQVSGKPAVLGMMKDQYANYVIQRILGTAKDDNYDRLARVVKQNLPVVKRSHYGKHLQAIERRLR